MTDLDKIESLEKAIKTFLAKYDELIPSVADAFKYKYDVPGHAYQGNNWSVELDALREIVESEWSVLKR